MTTARMLVLPRDQKRSTLSPFAWPERLEDNHHASCKRSDYPGMCSLGIHRSSDRSRLQHLAAIEQARPAAAQGPDDFQCCRLGLAGVCRAAAESAGAG